MRYDQSTQKEMLTYLMSLSKRQRQVLKLLAQGWDNHRIADELAITEGTVKNHITTIYMRINVRTRAEAVAWVWQNRLLELDE